MDHNTNLQISHPISDYIKALYKQSYPELFPDECIMRLSNIEDNLCDVEASGTILEVRLDKEVYAMDYSVCSPAPESGIKEYWLEIDYERYISKDNVKPCVFYDAERLRPDKDDEDFYINVLPKLIGKDMSEALSPALKKAVKLLAGRCNGLYQIGSMSSRGEVSSLRVYTQAMKADMIIPYLKDIGYTGETAYLENFLKKWDSPHILNFDLFEDHIGSKIGINISTLISTVRASYKLLEKFREQRLLLPDREKAIKRFINHPPQKEPYIQNVLSHIKVTFDDDRLISVKAYLEQSSTFINEDADHYFYPWQLNLELTTACPLHCPQCYIGLNTGREMPLETALSWIRDAKKSHVRCINLSGGETLCYPHLERLLEECAALDLRAAISLSGALASKERIKKIIDTGVDEIYVSLNGSTKEINSLTRDGYDDAIKLLALLQELGYDNICINWVMHRCNADDLPDMLSLCEKNNVKKLMILGFKPDSSGNLNGYSTAEQMQQTARIVKKYKGPVYVDAESCFSQLCALIHKSVFTNMNLGLERGCGAGVDGLSVNVEGKLTPCRHLDIPEEYDSISDYWENSKILKHLREISSKPEDCCVECSLNPYCLPCMDISYKLHDRLAFRMDECPLHENYAKH